MICQLCSKKRANQECHTWFKEAVRTIAAALLERSVLFCKNRVRRVSAGHWARCEGGTPAAPQYRLPGRIHVRPHHLERVVYEHSSTACRDESYMVLAEPAGLSRDLASSSSSLEWARLGPAARIWALGPRTACRFFCSELGHPAGRFPRLAGTVCELCPCSRRSSTLSPCFRWRKYPPLVSGCVRGAKCATWQR